MPCYAYMNNRSSGYFKDVRAKIFQSIEFFKFLLQADNELLVPEMQKKKKTGGHRPRFRDKACGKLT